MRPQTGGLVHSRLLPSFQNLRKRSITLIAPSADGADDRSNSNSLMRDGGRSISVASKSLEKSSKARNPVSAPSAKLRN